MTAKQRIAGMDSHGLQALVACPSCDLLHRRVALGPRERVRCQRCGTVLDSRKPGTVAALILASLAMAVLVTLALTAPFLELSASGFVTRISLLDAALALDDSALLPLSLLMIGLVVAVPVFRAIAQLWALLPVWLGFRPLPGAARAFRAALSLRPWAMAEIFLIGVAVSLVKLVGMAAVGFGPALWALGGAVLVVAYEAASLSRETVWERLQGEPVR